MTTPYSLNGFVEKFDQWAEWESPRPADWIRRAVLAWVLTRFEHPYDGVKRAEGFGNLWFGAVPGTQHGAGQVVVCSYWISELQRLVRCESFATLGLPL